MSEEKVTPQNEEEFIAWMRKDIKVKKIQVELQKLNTELAIMRYQQMLHMDKINKLTAPKPEYVPHVITQEDLDMNPHLVEQGIEVGQTIDIPNDNR